MKPRTITVVAVRWFDASFLRGEVTEEELKNRQPPWMVSSGTFIAEDKDSITLGNDYNEADRTWRFVLTIPKVNVVRVRKTRVTI